jgi:hypothetical protein
LPHPLWGFFPTEFRPEDDLPVQRVMSEFVEKFRDFSDAMEKAAQLLGGSNLNMSAKSAGQLVTVLEHLAPAEAQDEAFQLLPRLFIEADPLGQRSLALLNDLTAKADEIAELEGKVVRQLTSVSPPPSEKVAASSRAASKLAELGLVSMTAAQLFQARSALEKKAEAATEALQRLGRAAQTVSLQFGWDAGSLKKLEAVIGVIAGAPRDLLPLLHSGLRSPTAVAALQNSIERLQANQKLRADLGANLYLDAVPADDLLSEAIRTMREGDAWYRFLQRQWRNAIRTHRQLQRSKDRKTVQERLSELEQLRKLVVDEHGWREDLELRAASGVHFKDAQTPLESLLTLARWAESSDASLEEARVPVAEFDPVNLERATANVFQAEAMAISSALEALHRFEQTANSILGDATPSIRRELSDSDWRRRLSAVSIAAQEIGAAESVMANTVRPEIAAKDGLSAVRSIHEIPRMEAELSANAQGRELLGATFAGRRTNFETARAAHTYGTLIKKAALPASIERILLSPDCVTNHGQLSANAQAINDGWKAVQDFGAAMSKFGRFDPAAWADAANRTTSDYAKVLAEKTRRAADKVGGLLAWAQYLGARAEVTREGLESFAMCLECGEISPDKLEQAFLYRFYATVAHSAFEKSEPCDSSVGGDTQPFARTLRIWTNKSSRCVVARWPRSA